MVESLRYRCYTLEKAFDATRRGKQRLADAALYVLVDGGASLDDFSERVSALVQAEVSIIQLRDKTLSDRELLGRARRLRELTTGSPTLFVMNDRADLAALAQADGVHVGQDDLSVYDAQRIIGPEGLVGVSTHSLDQARNAVLDGAHYLGVGPTFPSTTKRFDHFTGLDFLRSVAAEISLPAFAIGGVDHHNVGQVREAGFSRVAVSGAVWKADDCGAAARSLIGLLRS
jgi:thiamine-phosphate pyrophosphorylase